MRISQCIPDGWIEAGLVECVRRASVCCVRIIRDFHGSDVGATHRSSGTVNRQGLPRLCKKGGAEPETIHQASDQRGYRSCRRHLPVPALSLSIHTLVAFDSNPAPGLNARIFQSDR